MIIGVHIIADFAGIRPALINNNDELLKIFNDSATTNGLHVVSVQTHAYDNGGFSGVLLLSESHLAFHTWVEYNSINIDIFSCGDRQAVYDTYHDLVSRLSPEHIKFHMLDRY